MGFVLVYVREAHPADRYRQPRTSSEKIAHARDLAERSALPFSIAVIAAMATVMGSALGVVAAIALVVRIHHR